MALPAPRNTQDHLARPVSGPPETALLHFPGRKGVNKCSGYLTSQNIGAGRGFRAHLVQAPHFTAEETELELSKVTQCVSDRAQIRTGVSSLLVHPEEGSVLKGRGLANVVVEKKGGL